MKNTLSKLGYLLILFAPLDRFKIVGTYFSIYRLIAIISFAFMAISVASNRKGKITLRSKQTTFVVVSLVLCDLLCILVSSNKPSGMGNFINDIFGIIIVLFFVYTFNTDDVNNLLDMYIKSQYISIAFSIYTYYLHFIAHKALPSNFSFLIFTTNMTDSELLLSSRVRALFPTVFLPYASTLHFDLSVGVAAIICIYFITTRKEQKIKYTVLSVVFSILLLLSTQRGPILAFAIAIIVLIYKYSRIYGIGKATKFLLIAVVFIILIVFTFGDEIFTFTIMRFKTFIDTYDEGDRHTLLIMEALYTWMESVKNLLVGSGYAAKANTYGVYTFIPNTYLCTYATLIAERGIIGTLGTLLFYAVPAFKLRRYHELMHNITIFILINFIFYEMRYIQPVWIMYSISYVVILNANDLRNNFYKANQVNQESKALFQQK